MPRFGMRRSDMRWLSRVLMGVLPCTWITACVASSGSSSSTPATASTGGSNATSAATNGLSSATSPSGSTGANGTEQASATGTTSAPPVNPAYNSTDNVLPIQVGGAGAPAYIGYNRAMTSVKVCTHGTTQCQTINNVAIDTQSTGLRIFASAVTVQSTPVTNTNGAALAECATFAASADWGSVVTFDVQIGNEPSTPMSVHLIDDTFATVPASCTPPGGGGRIDASPKDAAWVGLLGISPMVTDCGQACASEANNEQYFACDQNGACNPQAVPVSDQLTNPVSLFPLDNNGYEFVMNAPPSGGAQTVTGSVIFGIGTRANNQATNVTTLPANNDLAVNLQLGSQSYPTILDSGTAYYLLPSTQQLAAQLCSDDSGFLCMTQPESYSLTLVGTAGTPSASADVTFGTEPVAFGYDVVVESVQLEQSATQSSTAILGLPFFFGRSIFFGLVGATTSLGTGPFYAF